MNITYQITVNDNIQFLSTFMNKNKIFWISCMLWIESQKIVLDKSKTQIDQKSDMNVIQQVYVEQLELEFHSLSEVDFQELFMKCADNRETLLQYWVYLNIEVKRVWRCIWCFVISKFLKKNQSVEHLNFFLSIFWLYIMNMILFIQNSRIEIENFSVSKASKIIQKSELVFNQNHNLLMYSKIILTSRTDERKKMKDKSNNLNDSNNSNDFSDIENENF